MRGVAFLGNKAIDFLSLDDPVPGPDEVVLEMKASGLCGSDLKFYRAALGEGTKAIGFKGSGSAVIAGHEPCGIVAELGANVDRNHHRIGDRVMVHHYRGCTVCEFCRSGWPQMCREGPAVYGITDHGGHAPYMKVPASTLVDLPDALSFSTGAAIACGTGTAFGALVRANVSARDTVAIFGQGPVGLSMTQLACAFGASVIAIDVSPERLERAQEFGAIHVIDSSSVDPLGAIQEITKGRGVERAFDASGSPSARSTAVRCAAPWGVVCFVGEGSEVTIDVSPEILRKQLTIIGSWTFSIAGLEACARFIEDHDVQVDQLFTERWQRDQAVEAYRIFDQQSSGKAVFLS